MEMTRTLFHSSSSISQLHTTPSLHFQSSCYLSQPKPIDVSLLQSQTSLPIISRVRKPLSVACSASNDSSSSASEKYRPRLIGSSPALGRVPKRRPEASNDKPKQEMEFPPNLLAIQAKGKVLFPQLTVVPIYLVGMKSSIKTGVGILLSRALRRYWFDSDNLVEETAGTLTGDKSFREIDKNGFDKTETEIFKGLSEIGRIVVCVGDGAIRSSTNMDHMRHVITIWIDSPVDMVARDLMKVKKQLSAYNLSSSATYPEVLTQVSSSLEELRGEYATAHATVSVKQVADKFGHDDIDSPGMLYDMTLEVFKEVEKLIATEKVEELKIQTTKLVKAGIKRSLANEKARNAMAKQRARSKLYQKAKSKPKGKTGDGS